MSMSVQDHMSPPDLLEVDLQLEGALEVHLRLLRDVLHVLDLEVLRVVVRVLEGQLLAVEVDLRLALELALVVEQRVVGVHHDFALLRVQLVREAELYLHRVGPALRLRDHYIIMSLVGVLVLLVGVGAQLWGRPVETVYNEYGGFEAFRVQWRSEGDVCASCYVMVTFPEVIHGSAAPLLFDLEDERGVSYVNKGQSQPPASNVYYFCANEQLYGGLWYVITIYSSKSPLIGYGLVGMNIVSGVAAANVISYESNNAIEYYHLQTLTLPASTTAITPISSASNQASSVFPFQFTLTTNITSSQPTLLTFLFTNQNYATITPSLPLLQNNNFNFIGTCQVVCTSTSCVNPLSCIIKDNKVLLDLPELTVSSLTVEFTVLNPSFVDTTGLAAEITTSNGIITGLGIANNLFAVNPISILANGVNLHWGIPLATVQGTMGLGVFVDGGWNTVDVGFTLSQVTMIGTQFKLQLYVGASSVLVHSINTNLPSLNGTTSMQCGYILPYITCSPIDAFTSTTLRYQLKFKAYFASADNIATLGSITISLLSSNNLLFTPLAQALAIPKIPWANYRDSSGFHSSAYKIKETQVIGTADTGLANSTSTFMNSLFTSNTSFIGIDPTIPNQQLVFLMQTLPSQMSNGNPTQTYEMRVYLNPSAFSSFSTQGIDVAAYDAGSTSFRSDAVSCYVNSSTSPTIQIYQCQAYKDYVYGSQVDNIYSNTSSYGLFSFKCGNGVHTVCATGSCAESCRIFKGKSAVSGYSGVFSIRGVNFASGYQSSYLANEKTLDFIVAFYQAGVMVSATLINAYTVKQARLSYLSPFFYNTYLSSVKSNDGSRIPTLFSLQGHLSIPEINGTNYDEFAIFLPQEVVANQYVEASGRIGCTHSCQTSYIFNTLTLCQDNWLCKQKISIKGVQNIDSKIDIKVPVEVTAAIAGSFELALIKSSIIMAVYRIYGSAIADPLTTATVSPISVTVYSNPWASSTYWVQTATDTYAQSLNINAIAQFSPSNSIDMGSSSLSLSSSSPSLTFTSLYSSIFSSFTSTTINNQPSCNTPFTYSFNSLYDVTVLWCPMVLGGLNQVAISYPLYSVSFGAGFPFQNVFAYAVSDENNMVAYRTESNSKTAKDVCVTSHLNNFNYADVAQQKILMSLTVTPITLDSSHYPSMQIAFTAPLQIPLNYVTCSASETLLTQALTCTVVSSSANIGVLQLSSPSSITITTVQISLWVSPSAVSTASPFSTYFYSLNVQLPQTDGSGNSAFYGSLYSPFVSTASSCTNYINLMNVAATNQVIFITPIVSNAVALNYYADLTFNLKFSTARSSILSSSEIDLTFANAVTSSATTCSAWSPQSFVFLQQILSANTVRLIPLAYDTPFTFTTYNVTCSNLVISQNAVSITAVWKDGANTLQQSVSTPFPHTLPASFSATATLLAKQFNSLEFDSQFSFAVAVATNLNDDVEIWVGLNSHGIHKMVLECYYLSNGLSQQIYCVKDWQGKVHIVFTAVASANIQFSIYGIKQTSAASSTYKVLTSINKLQYYYANAADSINPTTVSAQPIIISNEALLSNYCLQLTLIFPSTFTGTFYVQIDDSLVIAYPQSLSCSIDGSVQTCTRVAPNLIAVTSTVSLLANAASTLQICELKLANADIIDAAYLRFKVFTMSGINVAIASHQHLLPYSLTALPVFPTTLMAWSETNFNTSWTYHQIYIGYYSEPVFLSTYSHQIFTQNFILASASFTALPYTNITANVLLGTTSSQIDIAYTGSNLVNAIDYLTVSHSSLIYTQPSILPIFISNRKCIVSTEYSLYDTYPGGITLPILLDFSKCRPAVDHSLTYSLSSAELMVDSGLSNLKVNATYPKVFIFVRQIPTNSLLNGQWALNILFSGPYSSSFVVTPSVSIKINAGTILQIPQSVPPAIVFQNSSMINLTLQCNQPSTIYWALGFYPTIMTITYEMIQTQLINGQQGVRDRVNDPYSWSQELYGLDYEYYANKNKTLVIDTLKGASNYLFKYFCVNQLGYSSGGQLINFTTAVTSFALNRVQLQYSSLLTIAQANEIACSIAEVLLTPYSTVLTSTFSNCINTSLTYFPSLNTTYYDLQHNGTYNYEFYIDSQTVPSSTIRSVLPAYLANNSHFINTSLPYSSVSIIPLINSYDPTVKNRSFTINSNVISCTIDVGVAQSYLILAYMQQTFDPMTMTLPPQYLIKLGNFSSVSKFSQVFMKYGSNSITINLTSLLPYTNYSIFYFVTVDNPAINSKYTQVYYQNIRTSTYLVYDLSSPFLSPLLALLSLLLMLSLR